MHERDEIQSVHVYVCVCALVSLQLRFDEKEFARLEDVESLVVYAQYNCLVLKVSLLANAKVWEPGDVHTHTHTHTHVV